MASEFNARPEPGQWMSPFRDVFQSHATAVLTVGEVLESEVVHALVVVEALRSNAAEGDESDCHAVRGVQDLGELFLGGDPLVDDSRGVRFTPNVYG